jgi:hypothetical protein
MLSFSVKSFDEESFVLLNGLDVMCEEVMGMPGAHAQRTNEEGGREAANKVFGPFQVDPVEGVACEFAQAWKVKILVPVDGSAQFIEACLCRDGRMCIVA